jgi:hypothetical protein
MRTRLRAADRPNKIEHLFYLEKPDTPDRVDSESGTIRATPIRPT